MGELGAETPTPAGTGASVIDIGGGNRFTISDVIAMKTAKEGLERDNSTLSEANKALQGQLDKLGTESYNVNQARIQSDAAKESAASELEKMRDTYKGWLSPDEATKKQEQIDLLMLAEYKGKTDRLAEKLKADPSIFSGKSMEEVEVWEQVVALQPKTKDPTLDRAGGGGTASVTQTALEQAVQQIADYRDKKGK
jgi:hypothetical protein